MALNLVDKHFTTDLALTPNFQYIRDWILMKMNKRFVFVLLNKKIIFLRQGLLLSSGCSGTPDRPQIYRDLTCFCLPSATHLDKKDSVEKKKKSAYFSQQK